jgi:iron complex outermembrane recepter protein
LNAILDKWSWFVLTALAASAWACAPRVAHAAEADANALQEVVVTAQRREQNLQDVPISVQAFSEAALLNAGVSEINELGTVTPSLNMTQQLIAVTPSIRGVGSPDASVGQESPVATYVDGVYLANPNASIFEFNGVERVEVLKGPQGTLFGRNATGGLVQVITKDPSHTSSADATVSYGNYQDFGAKLYATTGVTDSVAADVSSFFQDQRQGWGRNLTTGTEDNLTEQWGVRTKWLVDVGDKTQIRVAADYAKLTSNVGIQKAILPGSVGGDGQVYFAGCVIQLGGNPAAPTPAQFATCQPLALAAATRAPPNWQDSFGAVPEYMASKSAGISARIDHDFGNYSFGDLDFVSISAYRDSSVYDDWEQAGFPLPIVVIHIDKQSYKTFSQEFQLLSKTGRLQWIAGLYYYHDKSGFVGPDGIQITGIAVNPAEMIDALITTKSYAAFADATYAITDRTNFTAGVRITRDERDISQQLYLGGSLAANIAQDHQWTEPTYRAVLDHHFTDSTMGYLSYSRGFKSGNYNVTGIGTPAVNPEYIDAYETGVKTSLAGGRIQLNGAVYYYDYKDMQVSRIEAGSLVTVNAAAAKIKGAEFDFLANATSQLQFRGGMAWIDSEYTDFQNAPVYVPNTLLGGNDLVTRNLSGDELPRAPKFTGNLGATYTIPSTNGKFMIGLNDYYNAGFNWEPSGRIKQPSYNLLSAFLSWQSLNDRWLVRLHGENLTDEQYAAFALEQALGDGYASAAPLTYALDVTLHF